MKKVEVNNKSKEFFSSTLKPEPKRTIKGTIMTEEEFDKIMEISESVKK